MQLADLHEREELAKAYVGECERRGELTKTVEGLTVKINTLKHQVEQKTEREGNRSH